MQTYQVKAEENLALGEKAWEEKGKAAGVAVRSVSAEGVTLEQSWIGDIKGLGLWQDGRDLGTSTLLLGPNGVGMGTGQGIFTTKGGETVVYRNMSCSRVEKDRSRFVGVMAFTTSSEKLSWLNSTVCTFEGEGDPNFQEFNLTGYEVKEKLSLPEKVWVLKVPIVSMSIKSVGPEGVTTEANQPFEFRSLGRYPDASSQTSTATMLNTPSGITYTHIIGLFTTKDGETAVSISNGIRNVKTGKGIGLTTYKTNSQKLSWMNGVINLSDFAIDPNSQTATSVFYEWK
jgi:hypothetical protein